MATDLMNPGLEDDTLATGMDDFGNEAQPDNEFSLTNEPSNATFAQELRDQTVGCKVSIKKFGLSRVLPQSQVKQAAETFHANANMMSASKKLVDRKDSRLKRVNMILSEVQQYWYTSTIAYPVTGIRLLNRNRLSAFTERMEEIQGRLTEACKDLNNAWDEIKANAKATLGELYSDLDYPSDIGAMYGFSYEFPNVEPPNMLKELNPELYEKQQQMIASRFEEALATAEEALTASLSDMVEHLLDKLTPGEDGKKKTIYESSVGNLLEFFGQFRNLNIRSNAALTEMVEKVEGIVGGVDIKELRKDGNLRAHLLQSLAPVKDKLAELVVNKPTRRFKLGDEE